MCENVGTGLLSAAQHLRTAGLAPPEIEHTISDFKVVFRNHTVLDQPALEWLSTLGDAELNDRQRLGLAHVRRHLHIDNRGYRALTGCDASTATRDLTDLGRRGLLEKTGGRRRAEWRLSGSLHGRGRRAHGPRPPLSLGVRRRATETPTTGAAPVSLANGTDGSPSAGNRGVTAPEPTVRMSKRQRQVWDILAGGPRSSTHIADSLDVTRGAALNLLRALEQRGMVRTTQPGRRSRNQTWERTDA